MATRDDPFGLDEDRGPHPRPPGRRRPRTAVPRDGAGVAAAAARAPEPADRRLRARCSPSRPSSSSPTAPERPRDAAHPPPRRPDRRPRRRGRRAACRSPAPTPAAWAVAALLDDLALNTPWGGASAWPRQPLVSTLYGDVDAGARFFDRLEELERAPEPRPGDARAPLLLPRARLPRQYRVPGRAGARSLAAVRTAAARLLRDPEAAQAPLSPNWQGVVAADEPRRFAVPLWVLFAAAAVAAAAIYLALSLRLAGQAEQLAVLARALPPAERAEIFRPPRDTTQPPRAAGRGQRLRARARVRGRRPGGPAAGAEGQRDASRSPRSSSSGPTPSSSARPRPSSPTASSR